MFIDLMQETSAETLEADICIVGAGAAGISIAREFHGSRLRIALIESGGLLEDPDTEALNAGENAGLHAVNFNQRKRFFGGGTNCWGGNCAPFDPIDFEHRAHVPNSSWPITYSDLAQYYSRVNTLCGFQDDSFESDHWEYRDDDYGKHFIPDSGGDFIAKVFRNKALRFAQHYMPIFQGSASNITVYLNASVEHIGLTGNGRQVSQLQLITANRKRFMVHARVFVLAAGIENARLLLASDDVNQKGVGNDHDVVGRYFMVHVLMFTGFLVETPPYRNLDLYKLTILGNEQERVLATFRLRDQAQRQHELLNYVAHLSAPHLLKNWRDPIVRQAEVLARAIGKSGRKIFQLPEQWGDVVDSCDVHSPTDSNVRKGLYAVGSWSEQAPDPENRLELSTNRDHLGMRKITSKWRLNEIDQKTLYTGQQLLNEEFKRVGLGRIVSLLPSPHDAWPADMVYAAHYMGSTRMSDDPRKGVVDANCRVHGVANLYIAGGSVLPTSGATMVTYNLLALAIRLADHVREQLDKSNV